MQRPSMIVLAVTYVAVFATAVKAEVEELGGHGFANSGEIKIHYVTAREGPLVLLLHGFPDYFK